MNAAHALKSQLELAEKNEVPVRKEVVRERTAGELACLNGLRYALRHGNHAYSMAQLLGIYPT